MDFANNSFVPVSVLDYSNRSPALHFSWTMRKSFQNWLFGRRKSDQQMKTDEEPSTSREALAMGDVEQGAPKGAGDLGDGGDGVEPKTAPRRRWATSNVIQSTVVEDGHSAIPPVTLLVLNQDTADRISKVMDKFDSLVLDSPEPKRKNN